MPEPRLPDDRAFARRASGVSETSPASAHGASDARSPAARASTSTVLAFDYGARYVGVAVGDLETRLAHPLATIDETGARARFARIEPIVAEWRPALFVLGMPLTADGGRHPLADAVERFGRSLAGRFRRPVRYVDERFTSVEAESLLREQGVRGSAHKNLVHPLAAKLILESYLNDPAAGR